MRMPWAKEPEPDSPDLEELKTVFEALKDLAEELRDNQRRLLAQIEIMEASRDT